MKIDWNIAVSLSIPALVAICGWFFAHWLASKRERVNKRREIRLKGLEQAYLKLCNISNRDWTPEMRLDFEHFIAEIQLYGTPQQIDLTIGIIQAFIRGDLEISFDPLLLDLRSSLRHELAMEPIKVKIWWYRFQLPTWKLTKTPNQSTDPAP